MCETTARKQRTRMLSLTEQGGKIRDEMRIHFPGFRQCPRGSGLTSCTQRNLHTHTNTLEEKCTPAPKNQQSVGIFLTQGLTQRAGTSSAVVWASIILALVAPSLNHGEAANCQLLCPHYPRPPAQTGALGHCPRNHSAPVASQES